jgi:integrase
MTETVRLTDRYLRSLRPANGRFEIRDLAQAGLAIRVSPNGRKTFVMHARFPGSTSWDRRTIGEYDVVTLEEAREIVRDWRKQIKSGVDPKREEERRKATTFGAVAAEFIDNLKRRGLRRWREIENSITNDVGAWAQRPITEIDWPDVKRAIDAAIRRGSTWQAHHLFSYLQRLFNWAIDQGTYGLIASPLDRKKPSRVIGAKAPRTRVLSDDEIRALWSAAQRLGYPFGPYVQLLLLTGQRRTELANAQWSEIDLPNRQWLIPVERMKAKSAHLVPLSDSVTKLFGNCARLNEGEYVFSFTNGAAPMNGFSKQKSRLDKEVAMAWREAGHHKPFPAYNLHDLRRTMRTHLSALPVPDLVRELVIGHTKPGLHKVYDQHQYENEKREALELWADRLQGIVGGGADVVPMRGKR